MANVLTNFIVGLGFEVDQRSFNQATGSIDKLGTSVKAMAAGAVSGFGFKSLTLDLANSNAEIGRIADRMGTTAQFIKSLGSVYKDFGGDISTAISDLETVESMRTATEDQLSGMFSSAGVVGFNASIILNARSAEEAMSNIADLMERMPREEQLQIQRNLGFSDQFFSASQGGSKELKARIDEESKLRPITQENIESRSSADITQENIENSQLLKEQFNDLTNAIGSYSDKIGNTLIPVVATAIGSVNDWFDANKELIDSGFDKFLDSIADNFTVIATVLGVLTASKTISALRLLKEVSSSDTTTDEDGKKNKKRRFGVTDVLTSLPVVGTALTAAGMTESGSQALDFIDEKGGEAIDFATDKASDAFEYISPIASDIYEAGYNYAGSAFESAKSQMQRITIENKVMLDGAVIDNRIREVTGEVFQVATEDVTSSTRG